jgi:hypothetical protein
MTKFLALAVIVWTLILTGVAMALPGTMPTLKVTNPAPRTADLTWTGLPAAPWAVIFTNGLETVWPNTGFHEMYPVGPGTFYFKVCTSTGRVDVCTLTVKDVVN